MYFCFFILFVLFIETCQKKEYNQILVDAHDIIKMYGLDEKVEHKNNANKSKIRWHNYVHKKVRSNATNIYKHKLRHRQLRQHVTDAIRQLNQHACKYNVH